MATESVGSDGAGAFAAELGVGVGVDDDRWSARLLAVVSVVSSGGHGFSDDAALASDGSRCAPPPPSKA